MNSVPTVSVVIPAYNQAPLLRLAVESALRQTLSDLEVVIVDDGSTDGTREVCESFRDARVRYLHQANDGTYGLGARNRGMLEARGEWIALLDQDDVWAPTKLERQLERLAQEAGAGCSFCLVRHIDLEGRCTGEQRDVVPDGDVYPHLLLKNHFHASTGLFRRRLLTVAGLPAHGSGYGDWQLWLSLTRHTRAAVVHERLCDYRIQSSGHLQSVRALPDGRMRWAMSNWLVLHAHRPFIPTERPECRRALRDSLRENSKRFFRAALDAARQRNAKLCCQALRMAHVADSRYSGRPLVLVRRGWRLLKAWLGPML